MSFGFWRGTELTDAAGQLEGTGDRMRHVKLTGRDGSTRNGSRLGEGVVSLNDEKGDPTKGR